MRRTKSLAWASLLLISLIAACGSEKTEPDQPIAGATAGQGSAGVSAGAGTGALPTAGSGSTDDAGDPDDAGALADAHVADAQATRDADTTDAQTLSDAATADASTIDAYNGMCASARWSNVPQECWSCWCSKCATTLNAATRRSLEIFECMFDKELLVDDGFELLCEVKAGQTECVDGDTSDWDKLVAFDQCLIGMPTVSEFRACDAICKPPYPGDVCTRYPWP
jgi:hypothetical protein